MSCTNGTATDELMILDRQWVGIFGSLGSLETAKIPNRAKVPVVNGKKFDELLGFQLGDQNRDIDDVDGKDPRLQGVRLPLKNAIVVSLAPNALQKLARRQAERHVALVGEYAGVDRADARHRRFDL